MSRPYQCLWKPARMEHPPPGHANHNMSAKAYYNIHGYVTIHISIPLCQVYCNPPLRIPQYVFKYNYNYRWMQIKHAVTTLADMSSLGGCEMQWMSRDEGSDRQSRSLVHSSVMGVKDARMTFIREREIRWCKKSLKSQ